MSYDGRWGFGPLFVSLANSDELLYTVNRPASRPAGRMTTALRGGHRNWRGTTATTYYLLSGLARNLWPDGRHVAIYSIQNRKRKHPEEYREDLTTLFGLLREKKITPTIAERFKLQDAARAHQLMTKKTKPGKFVIVG